MAYIDKLKNEVGTGKLPNLASPRVMWQNIIRQGHRPVCGRPEVRARGDWRDAGGEAADAVDESPSLSAAGAAGVACVPTAGKGGSGRWSVEAARKMEMGRNGGDCSFAGALKRLG